MFGSAMFNTYCLPLIEHDMKLGYIYDRSIHDQLYYWDDAAIMTGYFDFALEVAMSKELALSQQELNSVKELIEALSFVDPIEMSGQVIQLANKIESNKANTNVYLGKFVDAIKFPDFADTSL